MATVAVSLPEGLQEFVDREVAEGGYGSPSEFILELLEAAQKQRTHERVEAMLREGMESGPPIEATEGYWAAKHRKLTTRSAAKSPERPRPR
jgi:antitoxin ParD1/3/4